MTHLRRLPLLALLCLVTGCNSSPLWMHPANLRKLNYQEPSSVDDGMFSLPNLPPEYELTTSTSAESTANSDRRLDGIHFIGSPSDAEQHASGDVR